MLEFSPSPYDHVKARVRHTVRDSEIAVPKIGNWQQMNGQDLRNLVDHLSGVHRESRLIHRTSPTPNFIGDEEYEEMLARLDKEQPDLSQDLRILNVDNRFATHIKIMHAYYDVLWLSPEFCRYVTGHTLEFLHACVELHDYGRMVFNGPFPLKYVDGVSDGILKAKFPGFPREYMHTIQWVTGEKPLPDMESPIADQMALILKAIDTLGKIDAKTGRLMDPNTFFAENGPHARWVALQVENGRLPFKVFEWTNQVVEGKTRISRLVTPEEYAHNDRVATLRGIEIIEHATGISFDQFRSMVELRMSLDTPPKAIRRLN